MVGSEESPRKSRRPLEARNGVSPERKRCGGGVEHDVDWARAAADMENLVAGLAARACVAEAFAYMDPPTRATAAAVYAPPSFREQLVRK